MNRKKDEKNTYELFEEYKKGNLKARDEIIKYYLDVANKIAEKYFNLGLENEDVINSAYEGLIIGISRYRKLTNTNFPQYIRYIIKTTIEKNIMNLYGFDYNDTEKPIRIKYKREVFIILKAKLKLEKEKKREVTLEEIKEETNIDIKVIKEIINRLFIVNYINFKENLLISKNSENNTLCDILLQQIIEELNNTELTENEKKVFYLKYIKGMNRYRISKYFNSTEQNIYSYERNIIKKLSENLTIKTLLLKIRELRSEIYNEDINIKRKHTKLAL